MSAVDPEPSPSDDTLIAARERALLARYAMHSADSAGANIRSRCTRIADPFSATVTALFIAPPTGG